MVECPVNAIGRAKDNPQKDPRLCSAHFEPHCFDESVDLQNKLMESKFKRRREVKDDAVPTIFAHKPAPKVRSKSVASIDQLEEDMKR